MTRRPFLVPRTVPLLFPLMIGACAAGSMATSQEIPDARRTADIAQVPSDSAHAVADQIVQPGDRSRIAQLGAGGEAPDGLNPEGALERDGDDASVDLRLYRDVALAWQAIRARGQQPSPELLAQSVGPENLATFLSTVRHAERIFRPDVDTWPIAPIRSPDANPAPMDKTP